jgi:hypothetical protein
VSYHVNELESLGWIELVRTEQRRGATEHFYRGISPNYLDDSILGRTERGNAQQRRLHRAADPDRGRQALGDVGALREAKGPPRLGRQLQPRRQGLEIGAQSEERGAVGSPPVHATFGLLALESPSRGPH